ncbi:MAG: glutamine synthetase [Negativicutes bacterium]
MSKELLYVIQANKCDKKEIIHILKTHPEIKFVSMVGIDLAGNDTDEKIPVRIFLKDIDDFYSGHAVQTDGSSVVLTGIATLNNAKVDMYVDPSVNWYIDYNFESEDEETGLPVGTLRIPAFLVHNGLRVDSRSLLTATLEYVGNEIKTLLKKTGKIPGLEHLKPSEIEEVLFTVGTELEFWVKSPAEDAHVDQLSSTQVMQENYWQRTRGQARTALEDAMLMLEAYGLQPEMGHKEVGGVKAKIGEAGNLDHVMEQMEIDWRFAPAVQAVDNELLARILVKEAFRLNGLEVSFQAKPIIGVAGSGEHTHTGMAVKLKSGKILNLYAPKDMKKDFMSSVGYGAIMGLLKNYEVVNPFITSTNDAFNRLKPGFEAPVCIVTSLGHSPEVPSRNRTILAGLVRDVDNPLATRFEVRAFNPLSNSYAGVAAAYLAMLDGIKAAVNSGKSTTELLAELSKEPEAAGFYLEKGRAYRSEHDVFDDYTAEQRDKMFGKPPATVWENMEALKKYPEKLKVLKVGNVMRQDLIDAFVNGALLRWKIEIIERIIPQHLDTIRTITCLHCDANPVDDAIWAKISDLRLYLAKDGAEKSLFTRIREALSAGKYSEASALQQEMTAKMGELEISYELYKRNLLDI